LSDDALEISNVLGEYVQCLDDRRFGELDRCFTPDAWAEYSGVPVLSSRDEIVEFVAKLERFTLTQHLLFPLTIRVDGAAATANTYGTAVLVSEHEGAAHAVTRGLSYDLHLVRGSDGWRISKLVQRALWAVEGDAVIAPGSAFPQDSRGR
jgi:hypothetical protein